jgi:fumarate hydratase class II
MTQRPIEKDISTNDFAEIEVDKNALWGKQTQRSLKYFDIGKQSFDINFIHALVTIKRASAQVNHNHGLLSVEQNAAIVSACDDLLRDEYSDQFPLRIWQTGSGTQTNMNVNEVIATLANRHLTDNKGGDGRCIHPNDHVNCSQSSNDVFPSAMHLVVAQQTHQKLLPAIEQIQQTLLLKQAELNESYTVGRTHMMDALPIRAGAALSGYCHQLRAAQNAVIESLNAVYQLALGGTAVGSGANTPHLFGQQVIALLAEHYQFPFVQHPNLYAAVSGEDALVRYSNSLKQLAAALLKIANDFRLLGSGPRCGLNEWHLPANEPGSSIMPGKVNPTQCEALSMVCLQVFGNDLTVSLAASNGQLQLNTYRPVIIHNVLESIELLSDAIDSFSTHCIEGLTLNQKQVEANMRNNLSVITLLAPTIGYDVATKIARTADRENVSLAQAAEFLKLYDREQFESLMKKQLRSHLSD